MLFREGCGELSERFRAWRLCVKRSRNVREFAPISTAIAASHSTSTGYSVTIPSLMGKPTSQIDNIGRGLVPGDRELRAVDLGKAARRPSSISPAIANAVT